LAAATENEALIGWLAATPDKAGSMVPSSVTFSAQALNGPIVWLQQMTMKD